MINILRNRIIEKTMHTVGTGNTTIARELFTIFFQEIRLSLVAFPQFWVEKDYKSLGMAAHKMAGACAYFGADDLFAELLKIESLSKKKDEAALAEVLNKTYALAKEVEKLEAEVFQII